MMTQLPPTFSSTTDPNQSNGEIGAPLTHAQESLYFLQQLTKGEPVYNMPQAFRLTGPLNLNALTKALRWVEDRHEALRTRIIETAHGPRQVVERAENACLRLHDLSSFADKAATLDHELQEAVSAPFDLQRGPIFRLDLFRIAAEEHVLLLNLHHIVGDMSSLGIIYEDLSAAYRAFVDGVAPEAAEVVLPVGEYARQRRSNRISAETVEFWRNNLKEFTAELDVPIDRFRPKYPSFKGDAYYFDLAPELPARLRELARKNRSSLYMVSLAALQALLYRYTGQEKFALATPFSDREDPALARTVGYLVNLLPIACDVRPNGTFRELLGSVRNQCLEVYGHHDISFRQILQELGISSESPKPPLGRVVFQYFPEIAALELKGLRCEPVQVHSRTSKFDLCVSMAEIGSAIITEIEFDTDIFTEASARRLAKHFELVLAAVVQNPDVLISEIELVDGEEARRLANWSETAVPYPRESSVHQLFEEQVKQQPTKVAIRAASHELTYEQLNTRANRIAQALLSEGVSGGAFVGVCLERSPDLIATLIAILKTGAAFVPIDAGYPKARLDYLFQDSGVQLLVTDSKHGHIAPPGVKQIRVDQLASTSSKEISTKVSAGSAAYVMYTSGSTGQPKGAMIPHRAITRLVKENDFAHFGTDETFLAFAPVSFDASTLEIWGALLNGGTLAIYPPQFESVEQFEAVLREQQVTTLWLTAGLFNTIVDRKVEALSGVRQLLVGGDVLSVAHIQKALAALPNTRLINGYGPTENTTFTCCYPIPRDLPENRSIPIGRPIRNTTVYILDDQMRPVPIGVPGTLYTGGDGLAIGYWNKPELTERSFVPHPFKSGERLYNTGDRARFLDDGTIEFLGRRDSQVKIRGFRIEIEEVEGAFRKITGVRDVAVVAHPDQSGGKSLVAYVVAQPEVVLDAERLREQVGTLLPGHACPSRILLLSELPLGPNGKVNRSALPAPTHLPSAETELIAPSSPIEAKLIELWRQVLEVPALGIDDNFFLLGGESLRATRAISQINAAFDCRLTLPRLFEAPTVRQMARIVENARQSSATGPLHQADRMRLDKDVDVESLSEQDVDALLAQLLDESRSN